MVDNFTTIFPEMTFSEVRGRITPEENLDLAIKFNMLKNCKYGVTFPLYPTGANAQFWKKQTAFFHLHGTKGLKLLAL